MSEVLAVGLLLAVLSGYELYCSFAAIRWRKTVGTVIGRETPRFPLVAGWRNSRITYSFEVDDYTYVSSKFKPGITAHFVFALPFLPKEFFQDSRFSVGAEVEVRFNPANPRPCALHEGDFVIPTLGVIAGIVVSITSFLR